MKKKREKKGKAESGTARAEGEACYPYTREEVSRFFAGDGSVEIAYLKVERSLDDFGHYLCELILDAGPDRLFLQGIQLQGKRFTYPPHLQGIPADLRTFLENQIIGQMINTRVIETPLSIPELAFTGERVVPGTAPFHAYWMHARRYAFAAKWCREKRVLDAGCGSGYGTRILHREAARCLGLDRDEAAVNLARSLFHAPGLEFAMGEIQGMASVGDGGYDVVVALEVLEHLPPGDIPVFLGAVSRVLAEDGTLVVSVANRHHPGEENPHHLNEMSFPEFRDLLSGGLDAGRTEFFGQDIWNGSYRLETECSVRPLRAGYDCPVFLAVVSGCRTPGLPPRSTE